MTSDHQKFSIPTLDIIPDFIPVIGWLDDLGIASFALSYIFSQMDKVQKLEFAKTDTPPENTGKTSEEILEQDITGTTGHIVDKKLQDSSGFAISVDVESSRLQSKISESAEIAKKIQAGSSISVLTSIEDRLASNRIQKIAVVGRYSTGKSTLINALLEKEILPSSPIPTTKAVTYIVKGENAALYSEMQNGEIIIHQSIEDLRNLYDKDIQRAQKITVTLPDFPFHDIVVADTPGLEDPDQTVTQLTLDMLPETDAIVMVFDAGYLESKVEFEFISSLLKNDKERKLFVVINKADGKTAEEIEMITQRCKAALIKYNVPTARIYALSAKEGMKNSGFAGFKTDLFHFLNNGIKQEAIRHTESELDAYSKLLLDACDVAIQESGKTQEQTFADRKNAAENAHKVTSEYDKQKNILCRKFCEYRSQFFLDFASFMDKLKVSVRESILQSNLESLKNTDHIAAEIKQQIVAYIDEQMQEIDRKIQADFSASKVQIQECLCHLDLPVNLSFRDPAQYADLFLPVVVAISYFFCNFLNFVWILIAAVVGRNFFQEAIQKFLGTVGINRVREELSKGVFEALDKAKVQLDGKLNTVFDTMENELISSFDTARDAALVPLSAVEHNTACDFQELTKCREKLSVLCKNNNQ